MLALARVRALSRLSPPLLRSKTDLKPRLPSFVEGDSSKKEFSKRSIAAFLWPYVFPKDNKLKLIMGSTVVLLVSSKVINVTVPFILKEGVNVLIDPVTANYGYAALLFGGFALARAMTVALQELRNALFSKIVLNAVRDVCNKLFWHLQRLDYSYHQQSTKTTLFAVGRSMKGIENFLKFMMQHILPTALEFGLASGILLYYCGWPYIVTLGGTVAVYSAFTSSYSKVRQQYISEGLKKNKAVDFVMNESLMNYEVVKCFNNEDLESKRYNHFLSQYIAAAIKTANSLCSLNVGQQLIYNAGLGINLLLAVNQVQAGTMSVGDIFMIQTLFLQLQFPLNFLGTVYRQLNESQLEMKELFNLLSIKPSIEDSPNAVPYQYKGGKIEFRNVSYAVGDRQIFKDLNLTIEPGSTNAIVGESGVGKSTLFRMLFRLLQPDSGDIFIDDQNIKDLQTNSLTKLMTLVPQTGWLFNDSILYNIQYGNPDATAEDIDHAVKMVNLHNRIMEFPDKYESQVGELGNKLSGGERQRLTIARSLLKNAHFYFFDEATSAMDSHNEKLISNELKDFLKGKTALYSAHRLSSITHVDKIFVLQAGKVYEEGTHHELLLRTDSKYSELWNKFLLKK